MADQNINVSGVVGSSAAQFVMPYKAAQNTNQGQAVWLNGTSLLWELATAHDNAHGANVGSVVGVAACQAYTNQPLSVCTADVNFYIDTSLLLGVLYVVSRNAGNICPEGDLASGNYRIVLGAASSNNTINLTPTPTGVTA